MSHAGPARTDCRRASGHWHYVPGGPIADVEGNQVRLTANGSAAVSFEEGI
jgi:hypothetical protein